MPRPEWISLEASPSLASAGDAAAAIVEAGRLIEWLQANIVFRGRRRSRPNRALPLGSTPATICSEVLRDLHGLVPAP